MIKNFYFKTKRLKKIYRDYFDRLYNDNSIQNLGDLTHQCEDINYNFMEELNNLK